MTGQPDRRSFDFCCSDPNTEKYGNEAYDKIQSDCTLETPTSTTLQGELRWVGGSLDLKGTVRPGAEGEPSSFEIVGTGSPGEGTLGWEYRYQGHPLAAAILFKTRRGPLDQVRNLAAICEGDIAAVPTLEDFLAAAARSARTR